MYRCKECQTEYEIKPDYCDCGNDTFDEILPEPVKPLPSPTSQINIPKEMQPKATPQPQTQPQTQTQTKTKTSVDMPSLIIFLFCIIMSFIVIFFVGNPKEGEEIVKKEEPVKADANIPNINSFWNNTLPKQEPEKITEQPAQTVVKPQVVPSKPTQTSIPQPQKKKESITSIYTPQKTAQKTPVKQTSKTASTTQNPTKKAVTAQPKATQQPSTQKQKTTTPQKSTTVAQQPTQPKTTVQQPTQVKTVNKQELANYKLGLRNVLASRMNFANVIGDGTCVVTFRISSSGALLNKKFAQQSDNFTLNDVVYNAVMQVNSYNPPPAGYRSETLRLTVKIYSGNFSVSLN